ELGAEELQAPAAEEAEHEFTSLDSPSDTVRQPKLTIAASNPEQSSAETASEIEMSAQEPQPEVIEIDSIEVPDLEATFQSLDEASGSAEHAAAPASPTSVDSAGDEYLSEAAAEELISEPPREEEIVLEDAYFQEADIDAAVEATPSEQPAIEEPAIEERPSEPVASVPPVAAAPVAPAISQPGAAQPAPTPAPAPVAE